MNKPHKHAALIKAWADGAEIQVKDSGARWLDMSKPTWREWNTYRIKPKTIKYRTYLWQDKWGHGGVYTCTYEENQSKDFEYSPTFIKWLGDWQEVEV